MMRLFGGHRHENSFTLLVSFSVSQWKLRKVVQKKPTLMYIGVMHNDVI